MTGPDERLEARVAAALRAEADGVEPGAGSLDAIRRRGHAARGRRRALVAGAGAAALVAVAVAVPLLDHDEPDVTTGHDRESTTTEAPEVTAEPAPLGSVDDALWPDPAGELFDEPLDVARSFVEAVVEVDDPPLSDFRAVEPDAGGAVRGEVDVFARGEDGGVLDRAVSTLQLERLDGEHWFVVAAQSTDVRIDSPEPLATVTSPVAVAGEGHGYEGTILVEMRARSADAAVVGDAIAAGGAAAEPVPFTADLATDAPAMPVAVLVARNTSGADLGVPAFSARPVRFEVPPDAPSTTPGAEEEDPGSEPREEVAYEFPQLALWPFPHQDAADEWLASGDRVPGWHASPEATALNFTAGYLGFDEIDQVTTTDIRPDEAWVGVGYETGEGQLTTSATIHLRRIGPDPDAPWEVVGTRDSDLVLDTPRYGSSVDTSSPVTVAGSITGVDESVRVEVMQLPDPVRVGEACCLPAGGQEERWETPVEIDDAVAPVATIVVSTGGHVQEVERFAITGVRLGP